MQFTPFFDKGESPKQWLRNFETCIEFKGYDLARQIKAFKLLMRNSAATWYDELEQQLAEDQQVDAAKWQAIRTKFQERFDMSNPWLEEHLVQFINQKPGESVQKYYSGLMEKANKLKKTKKEVLPLFIRGLNPPIKMYVLARQPEDLESAFIIAKAAESLEIISDLTSNNNNEARAMKMPGEIGQQEVNKTAYDMTKLIKELKTLGDKVADIKNNTRAKPDSNKIPMPIRCYHCKNVGQKISQCRLRLRDMQMTRQQANRGQLNQGRALPRFPIATNRWPRRPNVNMPAHQGN